jgi:chorismate dehydratase
MGYPRVGHINFLNCLPLTYSLRREDFARGMQVVAGVPSVLNNDIVNHRLDVSPVSSIVYARNHESLKLLPEVCISTNGTVQSIILVSRKPVEELRDDKIVLTAKSATSHCLLKIILSKAYGAKPNYYVRNVSPYQPIPEDAAASLLIGDDALYVNLHRESGLYYYDLGEEWKKLTGKWMVYAVWVVNRNFAMDSPELLQLVYDRITRGFRYGYERKADAIRSILMEKPFRFAELDEYLEVIKWKLGAAQLDGLEAFYKLAHDMNLIDHIPDIEIASVCR